ncbi:MAG: glycosyltransferase family 39 protein [Candidatus Acidiferrales bacterium]
MDAPELSPQSKPAAGDSRWIPIALVGVTLLAAALRLHALAAKSFWYDEGLSVQVARLSWPDFARALWFREGNMSLYCLLLRGWMLLGSSESWLRSLSVLFGVATIPVLYSLGRRLFGSRVGIAAATLMTVNVAHVAYSQQARSYSLTVFCVTLGMLCFVRYVECGGTSYGGAWCIASALSVYAHFFAGLVVLAEFLSLFFLRRSDFSWSGFFRYVRYWAYMLVPAAAIVLFGGGGQLTWLSPLTRTYFAYFVTHLIGNGGYWLALLYGAALILAGRAVWNVARKEGRSTQLWRHALAWLAWIVPIGLVVLAGLWRPLFLLRYLLICLPGLFLVAAVGICRLKWNWMAGLSVVVIAALSLQGVRSYYARDFDLNRDDWRDAARALLAQAQPGDAALFYVPIGRMTYEYYRSLDGKTAGPEVLYPAHAPGRVDYRDFIVEPLGESLQGVRLDAPRVWLVLDLTETPSGPDPTSLLLRNWCEASHPRVLDDEKFPGIELLLLSK